MQKKHKDSTDKDLHAKNSKKLKQMMKESKERNHEVLPSIPVKNIKGSPKLVMPKEQ